MQTDYSAIYRASYRLFAHIECIRQGWRPGEQAFFRLWIPDDAVREMDKKGGFTKENVLWWIEHRPIQSAEDAEPLIDFRAACGDIELPWAKEASQAAWGAEEEHNGVGPTKAEVESWNHGDWSFNKWHTRTSSKP